MSNDIINSDAWRPFYKKHIEKLKLKMILNNDENIFYFLDNLEIKSINRIELSDVF